MSGEDGGASVTAIDITVRPVWHYTGDKHFPFAALQSGSWWLLRLNYGFPEHDLYTLFVGDQAVADITANADHADHAVPLMASIGALDWVNPNVPLLDNDTASAVVNRVAKYADYGSEHGDRCLFCSGDTGLPERD